MSTLFIFRRDLRLEDNTGLIHALENAKEVIPCFIFTPQQIEKNRYFGLHCVKFMIESLQDLDLSLQKKGGKLYFFYGEPEDIVAQLINHCSLKSIVVNRDYTPYSVARDKKLQRLAEKKGVSFQQFEDTLLHAPEEVLKGDGKPYTVFTPFYRVSSRIPVREPQSNPHTNYYSKQIPFATSNLPLPQIETAQVGGRSSAFKILKHLREFENYTQERDIPYLDATTHLSAHLKFTTCSVREIYYAIKLSLKHSEPLLRQLYWRDFFTSIAYFFPYVFEGAFHSKYDKLTWSQSKQDFQRWCEGKTGFPIIDAGMRELNAMGYMHNRVRMLTGSFLVKDLHLDWRWGERYFAEQLIDYDPAVNNGNWQWVAGTGCDAAPYFRIFNPWIQQKKFDPEAAYIKKWVPELREVPPKEIHQWRGSSEYPAPMVDHTAEAKKALEFYKSL